MALKLDILANTRQAQKEVKDLSKELDKTADSLDDLARDGDKAGAKLESSFRDMVKEAKKADTAIEDIGGSGGGFQKAGKASGEFKQEALANFSEVTSSFDGSMSSIQDLAQGTLGGLASSLPGIGIAAGGAAVAIGAIGAALSVAEEQRKQLEERANDLANAYIDAGTAVLDAVTLSSRTAEILTDPAQRKEAEALAKAVGVDLAIAVRAYAGDAEALAIMQTLVNDATAENNRLTTEQVAASGKRKSATSDLITQNEKLIQAGQKVIDVNNMATDTFKQQQKVLIGLSSASDIAAGKIKGMGDAVASLPTFKQITVDVDLTRARNTLNNWRPVVHLQGEIVRNGKVQWQ